MLKARLTEVGVEVFSVGDDDIGSFSVVEGNVGE